MPVLLARASPFHSKSCEVRVYQRARSCTIWLPGHRRVCHHLGSYSLSKTQTPSWTELTGWLEATVARGTPSNIIRDGPKRRALASGPTEYPGRSADLELVSTSQSDAHSSSWSNGETPFN